MSADNPDDKNSDKDSDKVSDSDTPDDEDSEKDSDTDSDSHTAMDDEEDLSLMTKKFMSNKTMSNLRRLLLAFLLNPRSVDTPAFCCLWESLPSFSTMPYESDKERRDVLQVR